MSDNRKFVSWPCVVVTIAVLVFAGYALNVVKKASIESANEAAEWSQAAWFAKESPSEIKVVVIDKTESGCDATPDPTVRVKKDWVIIKNNLKTAATLKFDSAIEWGEVQTQTVTIDPNDETFVRVTNAVSNAIPFDVYETEAPSPCSPGAEARPKIIINPQG